MSMSPPYSSQQPVAEAEQECREVQAVLGIGPEELLSGSYADLLAE